MKRNMETWSRVFIRKWLGAGVALAALSALAQAQGNGAGMRPGQPAVLPPPPASAPVPIPDFASEFSQRYQRARAPRIMLFWNAELSHRAGEEWVLRDNDQTTRSTRSNDLQESTAGPAGNSTLNEATRNELVQRRRETVVGQLEDPKRTTTLSERNSAQLLRAFEARMRDGNARMVDYALAVRTTALGAPAGNRTPNVRTLEAAAVRDGADLLLQILFVADDQAPARYGFDVSVRDVTDGTVLASFYTRAAPPPPPTHTSYVATQRGFERKTVAVGSSPGIGDVGISLANEIMNQLGPVLRPQGAMKKGK